MILNFSDKAVLPAYRGEYSVRKARVGDEDRLSRMVGTCIRDVVAKCKDYGQEIADAIAAVYTVQGVRRMIEQEGEDILICSKGDEFSGSIAFNHNTLETKMWYFKNDSQGFRSAVISWDVLVKHAKACGHPFTWGKMLSTARPVMEKYGASPLSEGDAEEKDRNGVTKKFKISYMVKPFSDDFDFGKLYIEDGLVLRMAA